MSEVPKLWSDFDGTAVAIFGKRNLRNWLKYPLPAISGYLDFLRGAQSPGVEMGGIVTRRPDIFPRRMATMRSIGKLGFSEFYNDPQRVVHAGSERAKGRFVVGQSEQSVVGMLEDQPQKLGPILFGALSERNISNTKHHPLVLGVVAHELSSQYIKQLVGIAATQYDADFRRKGSVIESDSHGLQVVALKPYSQAAGQEFGERLMSLAED